MLSLLENSIFLTVVFSTFTAQALKSLIILIVERKLILNRMVETGGMPSSHSATVASLATAMGMVYGWNSPYFTISMVLAGIVIHDATGVRAAAGRHAEMLNDMTKELAHLFEHGYEPEVLKTLLGHTYPQAVVGTLLGMGISYTVFR
ncbi:MAG: divergent PAP2 family protein [Spirochaetes bacterium]|nr:MAG: divergent PAP2 family protein [Spirochaetota bacterium]